MGFVDPYIDEETGELRNLIGTIAAAEFREIEPQIVFANELELESVGIPRSDDLAEVCAIHRQLFHNVQRLSYFYDHLNYIHPFRDGNGRTQRIFWTRVARDAGYEVGWNGVIGDENDRASRLAAEGHDLTGLQGLPRLWLTPDV